MHDETSDSVDQQRNIEHNEEMVCVPKQLEIRPTITVSMLQSTSILVIPHLLDGRGHHDDEADSDQHPG